MVIGRKIFGSVSVPLFLYYGTMLPASQVSEIIPELKIRLNRSTHNDKNTSEDDFMNSFLTISSPDAL